MDEFQMIIGYKSNEYKDSINSISAKYDYNISWKFKQIFMTNPTENLKFIGINI